MYLPVHIAICNIVRERIICFNDGIVTKAINTFGIIVSYVGSPFGRRAHIVHLIAFLVAKVAPAKISES